MVLVLPFILNFSSLFYVEQLLIMTYCIAVTKLEVDLLNMLQVSFENDSEKY
jgi:hypothetical protein